MSWLLALGLTFIVVSLLRFIFPVFKGLHYIFIALIFYGISMLFGIVIFYFLTRKTNALTSQINDAIHRIASGDFSARLNFPHVNEDIDAVVDNFNKMAEELDSLAILNKDFVSNFSHEFKTPIVSIKGYAELLSDSPGLTDENKEYLNVIIDESNRLSYLSDSAMTLSKLDSGQVDGSKTDFWLDDELSRSILLFDKRLTDKNLQVKCDIDGVMIRANKNLTREIWINLLSNAVKFTPKGGVIRISLKEHGGYAFVTVSDTGIGLNNQQIAKLFDRNYQGDTEEKVNGNGIGLAIAKRIVELHGGTIRAEDTDEGAQFVVKLPLNRQ